LKENLHHWVGINLALSANLRSAKIIRRNFPSISEVFTAGKAELTALGIDAKFAEDLVSPDLPARAERMIEKLGKKGIEIITVEDDTYPEYLRETFDPPLVLYCAGDIRLLKKPAVAIVGARKPTPYGRAVGERLAHDLAQRGLVIVSGLARGIDTAAHWGALSGGKTIAVMGSGLEIVYPRENKRIFEEIERKGVVISELPPASPPLGFHFPMRNRIISGLALGLVVVEATSRSGSLISARLALEQNREVMAVPGAVTSDLSRGTNWLLKTGARLVESWEDVIEGLPSPFREALNQREEPLEPPPVLSSQEEKIYRLLRDDIQTHIDDVVEESKMSVSEVLSLLLQLELKGVIRQNPGKNFQRKL